MPKAETSGGNLDSLSPPHFTTAGLSCQTASLFLGSSEKHPVIETSKGRRQGTGGGESKGPGKITCYCLHPCYL